MKRYVSELNQLIFTEVINEKYVSKLNQLIFTESINEKIYFTVESVNFH